MTTRPNPPFRADHVGSFLRPAYLLEAREKKAKGEITPEQLREVEDRAIDEIVRFQADAGLQTEQLGTQVLKTADTGGGIGQRTGLGLRHVNQFLGRFCGHFRVDCQCARTGAADPAAVICTNGHIQVSKKEYNRYKMHRQLYPLTAWGCRGEGSVHDSAGGQHDGSLQGGRGVQFSDHGMEMAWSTGSPASCRWNRKGS
jgi:hypothetical protein